VFRRNAAAIQTFELELAARSVAAGSPIGGRVAGLREPLEITLLRVERCPAGTVQKQVGSQLVAPGDGEGAFELVPPGDTPPSFVGPQCALGFAVRARTQRRGRRQEQVAAPVAIWGGEQRVHDAPHLHDRLIASFPARGFHIEIADALLEGGGRIEGRIHSHDELARSVEVTARCEEAWRTNLKLRNRRHPPLWREARLWEETSRVECEAGRHWHPFAFTIPGGLPPAVEGYIVSWRYEVEARCKVRVGLTDRAVITPLRFEVGH
jgi:arrestin (S-antigen)-like protein